MSDYENIYYGGSQDPGFYGWAMLVETAVYNSSISPVFSMALISSAYKYVAVFDEMFTEISGYLATAGFI